MTADIIAARGSLAAAIARPLSVVRADGGQSPPPAAPGGSSHDGGAAGIQHRAPLDYSPERREIIQSCRLFAQKLLLENDCREAVTDATEALTLARMRRAVALSPAAQGVWDEVVAQRAEAVRLAEEALVAAGVSFDGACLDFHATLVDRAQPAAEAGDAGNTIWRAPVTNAKAHALLLRAPE